MWTGKTLLMCSLFLLAGCAKKEVPPPVKFPVKVGMSHVEDVPHFVRGVGQLIPTVEVDVKAQVRCTMTNVLFTDGQRVEEGALLMTIDPRYYEAQVQQAIAQLDENRAKLRYALDFEATYGTLVGQEYVSRLDYEQAIQNVDIYKANIELA